MSIYFKILLPSTLIIVFVCLVMGFNAYVQIKNTMISMAVDQADMAASTAVSVIDGDMLMNLEPGCESGDEYQELLRELSNIQETCGIKYLFTLYEENGFMAWIRIKKRKRQSATFVKLRTRNWQVHSREMMSFQII